MGAPTGGGGGGVALSLPSVIQIETEIHPHHGNPPSGTQIFSMFHPHQWPPGGGVVLDADGPSRPRSGSNTDSSADSFSRYRVTAEVKHNSTNTIVCKAQGEWNGTLEFTYSSGETKVIDTDKLPVTKKKLRPVERQGRMESRLGLVIRPEVLGRGRKKDLKVFSVISGGCGST